MTQSIDLSGYQSSLNQAIDYERMLIGFTLQPLNQNPAWYDDFSNSLINMRTNAMSWSYQVVPQLISVPQEVVNFNPPVKARFDSLFDDLNELTQHPEDGDSLQDVSDQIKGLEQIQNKLIGDIETLLMILSEYENILSYDEDQQQMYLNDSQMQIAQNQSLIDALQTEITSLSGEKHLNKKGKAQIQSDQQQIDNCQQDNTTLQSLISSLSTMMQDNSNAQSGSAYVLETWNQLNELLFEINNLLEQTQSTVSQNQDLILAQVLLTQAQVFWNEFEAVCVQLIGYQYG